MFTHLTVTDCLVAEDVPLQRHGTLKRNGLRVVLATGPGNPPAVRFLAGGSVRFGSLPGQKPNRYVLAGLLPGPNRNPVFFGRVGTGPRVHFAVPTFLAPIKYLSSDRIMT
jgi:hypothetical protein